MWYLIEANKQIDININGIILFELNLDSLIFMCEKANNIGIKKNINVWFLVNSWWKINENVNKTKIKK